MKSSNTLSRVSLLFTLLIAQACGNSKSTESDGYKATLKQTQLEGFDYVISIPDKYTLQPTHGADFDIFYFYPSDTTIRGEVAGGLYFGKAPAKFGPEDAACKITSEVNEILGKAAKWEIYSCETKTSMETILTLTDSTKVHLFGSAKSAADAKKIQVITSTLSKK